MIIVLFSNNSHRFDLMAVHKNFDVYTVAINRDLTIAITRFEL